MKTGTTEVRIEAETWQRAHGHVLKTVVRIEAGQPLAGTFVAITNQTKERKV